MSICVVCKNGYCPNRRRKTFGKLPPGICSPTCVKAAAEAIIEDKSEVLAELICQTLMEAGHIDDFDCDTVKLIQPLLKPL